MRDDFCVFILTHGRPESIYTLDSLYRAGYSGKVFIVIDNEDQKAAKYRALYGESVLMFDKEKTAKTFDEGDNFNDRRAIVYARNACFELAQKVGCRYFMQLDDDYTAFNYKFNSKGEWGEWSIYSLDDVLDALLEYYLSTDALTIAMAQNGDFIGGGKSGMAEAIKTKRKAMNTFLCSADRPFQFFGRINEDVNTYTNLGRRGFLFLTVAGLAIIQKATQSNSGGMTELYLDSGTYVKSFYSVMYSPSCVKIAEMGETHRRLHHRVNWRAAVPKILPETERKSD